MPSSLRRMRVDMLLTKVALLRALNREKLSSLKVRVRELGLFRSLVLRSALKSLSVDEDTNQITALGFSDNLCL